MQVSGMKTLEPILIPHRCPSGAWEFSTEIGFKGFKFHAFHLNHRSLGPLNPFSSFVAPLGA